MLEQIIKITICCFVAFMLWVIGAIGYEMALCLFVGVVLGFVRGLDVLRGLRYVKVWVYVGIVVSGFVMMHHMFITALHIVSPNIYKTLYNRYLTLLPALITLTSYILYSLTHPPPPNSPTRSLPQFLQFLATTVH